MNVTEKRFRTIEVTKFSDDRDNQEPKNLQYLMK